MDRTLCLQPGPIRIKTHLPVAAREIRVAALDRGVYRGRVIIAALTLLATSWILYSLFEFAGQASSAVGQQIFALKPGADSSSRAAPSQLRSIPSAAKNAR